MASKTETADRVKDLKEALRGKLAANQELGDTFEIVDRDGEKVVEVNADQKKAFDANMADIKEIQSLIESNSVLEDAEKWANSPAGTSAAQRAAAEAHEDASIASPKSLGREFLDSDEFKYLQGGRNGYTMASPWEVKIADMPSLMHQKDVYSDIPTGTPGRFGPIVRDPIVPRAHRQIRIRDLFPVRTTNAAIIEYFRVTGFTNNASPVAERNIANTAFAAKNQSTLTFVGEQSTVRTIAHWEAAHRNVLSDEPQLAGIIDNELMYGLQLEEDLQILSGTGTGEDLLGVLRTPGVQPYNWSSGVHLDNKADAIRRAATLAFLANYVPTGVVLHPNDWEDIELAKDTVGQYLVAVAVAIGGEQRLWRMPVVDTPAIAEGTALVGAFGIGAQLYDREQGTIRIAEQHSDFFVRNAVVVLAEERLALATKRPESFVKVTFDSAPA